MHGGVKFYRGSAAAARNYVEADRSRVDDYYLAEGTGLATHYVALAGGDAASVRRLGQLDGPAYEQWVAGLDATGAPKGRLRTDDNALRFVEVVVNGPKTWSMAAALHPALADAYDAAQERAATGILTWLAAHATTRVGPRGRQVQVPVERLDAAVVRHYTSRAGDPHRHLHLQINARVFAHGAWRGLHSVGVVDSIEALNGIGHAAVACDPQFRAALAAHGYSLDPETGEITQLASYSGSFSARSAQIGRNIDRYEADWRRDHPGQEPGAQLRRSWDRRAWADARPDKIAPRNGADLTQRWNAELHDLGYTAPTQPRTPSSTPIGRLNRDAVVEVALGRLGARRSSWNTADIRGEVERIIASADIVAAAPVRHELAEDLTARVVASCRPLLDRPDVPEHVRCLTSERVLAVEAEIVDRLVDRAAHPGAASTIGTVVAHRQLDAEQRGVVEALVGTYRLVTVDGAAGAGKTTTLAAAGALLSLDRHRLVVCTPTHKAAHAARREAGVDAHSAGWLVHQHGFRWDDDGQWGRVTTRPDAEARLFSGDLLLVDEAGMLDQDTARALLQIADECGARVAFMGDRHQLPAVGRGGVLDLAARWTPPEAHLCLDTVRRFTDPEYAALSLQMRTGEHAGDVFDALLRRGEVVVHPSEVERLSDVAELDGLVIADTRDQVGALNLALRERRLAQSDQAGWAALLTTRAGEPVTVGDLITTRRNERDLDVANRDTWTVTGLDDNGTLRVTGDRGRRALPVHYARTHVELAYATTVHGAQGQTVDTAHLLIGEATGAASAYVGMTRGRRTNVAHLVAGSTDEARQQWVRTFGRDRADLGPRHAAHLAEADIERHGPTAPRRRPPEVPPRRQPSDRSRSI